MTDFTPISKEFTELIATREYEIVGDEKSSKIFVEIGAPIQDVETASGFDWRCPIRIIDKESIMMCYACGSDSFQALSLAMHQALKLELEHMAKERSGKIYLYGEEYTFGDYDF